MKIMCEVSLGELVDKLSILKIKLTKIDDSKKLELINIEHNFLEKKLSELSLDNISKHLDNLTSVNTTLWNIEDDIRELERSKNFGDKFVELARSVYFTNDERFKCKDIINETYGSAIREVKSYKKY